jgi:hypothetical protein
MKLNNYQFATRAKIAKHSQRQARWYCIAESVGFICTVAVLLAIWVVL